MEIQKVNLSHGWLWINHGYRLIMRAPLHALTLAMLAALGMYLTLLIPVVGVLLAILLLPILLAGYMRVCRALEFHQKVAPTYLFEGFEKRTPQLITLGGLLMLGMIFISIVITVVGGPALTSILESYQATQDPNTLMASMLATGSSVALSLLLGLALLFVLMLALQFAPMLVFFDGMAPLAALKTSLAGSLRNIIPFTVYSLILQLFATVASIIPFDLGWILLLPLGLTSMYVSYRDIFASQEKADTAIEGEVVTTDDSAPL